jgi:hypothetical protein
MPFATSHFVTSGRFELVRVLGKGAGGTVYLARDLVLNREVAVKEAIPGAQGFDVARQKFQQEARIQARFDHPNIIKVYTVEEGPASGEVYAFCEYARGGSLADRLERLVLGDNIREWRVELPGLVTTVGSPDTAVAFEGPTKAGDKGVIDMITITVPRSCAGFR